MLTKKLTLSALLLASIYSPVQAYSQKDLKKDLQKLIPASLSTAGLYTLLLKLLPDFEKHYPTSETLDLIKHLASCAPLKDTTTCWMTLTDKGLNWSSYSTDNNAAIREARNQLAEIIRNGGYYTTGLTMNEKYVISTLCAAGLGFLVYCIIEDHQKKQDATA